MPSLTILVGPSGSGKSTYAALELMNDDTLIAINADSMREVITGDASEQGQNKKVFEVLHYMVAYLMKYVRRNILLDNTSLTRAIRKTWIDLAKQHGYIVKGVIFHHPLELCLERNLSRKNDGGRFVPEDVIRRQYASLVAELPSENEGFDKITFLNHV